MTSLPKTFDPKACEKRWYSFWKGSRFFHANPSSGKPPFSIVIPPPNVTGVLHMGHALVDTVQDILIRYKRMDGFEALWVPGTDHAGIATQTVVERFLFKTTGKRRKDFDREEFLGHVWKWKESSQEQILSQLEQLGCSCDWDRLRFTLDETCSAAVRTAFKQMYDQGLIYRGDYLVNWDPVAQTALSDDEVEFEERSSFLWHIRYPVEGEGASLIVATTRPETMLGDTAVAVHPDDPRYRSLIGKRVKLPLTGRLVPIVADPFVDREFGTGAVKITPAHDFADFAVAERHRLPLLNILTPDGRISLEGAFAGLSVEEARSAVVKALKSEGALVKEEPHLHRVGVSYRSKAVLEPYLSKQWFVKLSAFKGELLAAVREKRVELIPPHWEQTYAHWIDNLRDWCISRQLWWGHRIPIWYCQKTGRALCYAGEGIPPEVAAAPHDWVQDPDVLDTWFSSALWPLSVFGWPAATEDLTRFYPTSVLVTGHDILFFWVARMILMGLYAKQQVPFHQVFLHGLIYGKSYWRTLPDGQIAYLSAEEKKGYDLGTPLPPDVSSKWEKMSKSKGNVIDPLEIIDEYGADALRMALASSVTHARQIDLDRRRFEEWKNFANKVWNGARFVLSNLSQGEPLTAEAFAEGLDSHLLALEDKWFLSVLNRTIGEIRSALDRYAFDKAASCAYSFFWNDFCSVYLEAAKPILFGKAGTFADRANKQKLLAIALSASMRLLHPMAPFITEEIFSLLKAQLPPQPAGRGADPYTREALAALSAPACIVAPYPQPVDEAAISPEVEARFGELLEAVRIVRNLRTELQIPPSEKTDLLLVGPRPDLLLCHAYLLQALTPTASVQASSHLPPFGASGLLGALQLFIPLPEQLKAKEQARLEKEAARLDKQLSSTQAKLDNPEFREKAPQELVSKLHDSARELAAQLTAVQQKLQALNLSHTTRKKVAQKVPKID
jgi:valyl-tRNA synthetase